MSARAFKEHDLHPKQQLIQELDSTRLYNYNNDLLMYSKFEEKGVYDILVRVNTNVESLVIPSFVKEIFPYAIFQCEKIKSIEFERDSQLLLIDDYGLALDNNQNFVSPFISIPNHVRKIGKCAFYKVCCRITNIHEILDLEYIGDYAFQSCLNEIIKIPASVKHIGNLAFGKRLQIIDFDKNSQLYSITRFPYLITKIVIPASVKIINESAFCRCSNLKFVEFLSSLDSLFVENCAFSVSSLEAIKINSRLIHFNEKCFLEAPRLVTFDVSDSNEYFSLYNNDLLLTKDNVKNDNYDTIVVARRDIEIATIPPFIKKIHICAFDGFKNIKQIDNSKNHNLDLIKTCHFYQNELEKLITYWSFIEFNRFLLNFNNLTHLCIVDEVFDIDKNKIVLFQKILCFSIPYANTIRIENGIKHIVIITNMIAQIICQDSELTKHEIKRFSSEILESNRFPS